MAVSVGNAHGTGSSGHGRRRPDAPAGAAIIRLSAGSGPLRISRSILRYETAGTAQFVDITNDVDRVVRFSGIVNGTVTVFSEHTTAAIKISENEPELLKDLEQVLASVAPEARAYFHNDFTVRTVNMVEDECPNGQAHCQHLLLGTSETIPLADGRLLFGSWQRLFLIELDHGRTRDVAVTVMGC